MIRIGTLFWKHHTRNNRISGIVSLINGGAPGDAFAAVLSQLAPDVQCWAHGQGDRFPRIDHEIRCVTGDGLNSHEYQPPSIMDRALYIYTSGTTGSPKAANVGHFRLMQWSYWFAGMLDTRPSDRMYNCLPMYHSVGGVVAIGAVLVNGGSAVLRQRFSASRFWDDVDEWDCSCSSILASFADTLSILRPIREKRTIGSDYVAEMGYDPTYGGCSSTVSVCRGSSNFMRQLKAISPFTTAKVNPALSAGSRRF
jgi:hypothetical protein